MSTEPWFPIRTDRLLLRDFRREDFDDVHVYGQDPEVARYMPWGPNTPEQTREFLEKALVQQGTLPRFDFGFAIEHEGKVVGAVALHLRDVANRTVELGYCLASAHWRRGIVSEAAHALVDAGFRKLGLHRIFATCDARNTGSFGVMEKIGMRREGLMLSERQTKGEWRDTYLYAVLAGEWLAR